MLEDIEVLRAYFLKLGLEAEIADIYLALHAYGPQTISEVSRRTKVERTRIYRLIEALTDNNLIEVETHYKRSILKAAPISNLQILLSKKEEELRTLQDELAIVQQAIAHQQDTHSTQVQFFKGIEGLKQMFWNETRSYTENLLILYENIQSKTNVTFFERWVREFNRRGLHSRGLIGDHFIEDQKKWYKQHDTERARHWKARYVPTSVFEITHSTVIYDDVVAYYNWREGNTFGIEIHNQEIAEAQRSFFEILWAKSKPIPNSISQQLKGG